MTPDLARVAVVGTACSGKTTLARRLAERLDAPHVEIDALYWLPDWKARTANEFRALVAEAVAAERWVSDGNYGTVRDLVWARATAVLWLDYPFPIVLWRALSRTLRRIWTQEVLFSGNRETFRLSFLSRDSILWWVITTHRRRHRSYAGLTRSGAFPHLTFVRLRSPRETEAFLREV